MAFLYSCKQGGFFVYDQSEDGLYLQIRGLRVCRRFSTRTLNSFGVFPLCELFKCSLPVSLPPGSQCKSTKLSLGKPAMQRRGRLQKHTWVEFPGSVNLAQLCIASYIGSFSCWHCFVNGDNLQPAGNRRSWLSSLIEEVSRDTFHWSWA